jgi:hypothetical protein
MIPNTVMIHCRLIIFVFCYHARLIKAQLKDSLKRNDFDTYTLIQNLFSQDPAVKEAAWQELKGMIIASEQGNYKGKW